MVILGCEHPVEIYWPMARKYQSSLYPLCHLWVQLDPEDPETNITSIKPNNPLEHVATAPVFYNTP